MKNLLASWIAFSLVTIGCASSNQPSSIPPCYVVSGGAEIYSCGDDTARCEDFSGHTLYQGCVLNDGTAENPDMVICVKECTPS